METIRGEQLEHLFPHLNIYQMLDLVKKSGNTKTRRFRANRPKGSIEGTIEDPYMGILLFDGQEGFIMSSDLRFCSDITYELI